MGSKAGALLDVFMQAAANLHSDGLCIALHAPLRIQQCDRVICILVRSKWCSDRLGAKFHTLLVFAGW